MTHLFDKLNIIESVIDKTDSDNKAVFMSKYEDIVDQIEKLYLETVSTVSMKDTNAIVNSLQINKNMCNELFKYYLLLCANSDSYNIK